MKCPWCNAELKDGTVLCATCGNEINMVPDFDPEIEDQCRVTIETMTKDIFSSDEKAKKSESIKPVSEVKDKSDMTAQESSQEKLNKADNDSLNKENATKKNIPIFVLFIFIFAALLIAAIVILIFVSSDSYKLSQAQKAYQKAEYDKSKGLYQVLIEKEPENIELLEAYSYVLFEAKYYKDYENVFYSIIDNPDATEELKEQAYERMIYIYSGDKEYMKIHDLIVASQNSVILDKYKDFLTIDPEVMLAPGTYDLPQMLTITCSDEIYYTLINEFNGETVEIARDEVYRLPLLLEIGTYKLTVYSKNKYDIKSNLVEAEYDIEIAAPIDPEVSLVDGTYISPQLLEVFYDDEALTIYFTSDGSVPGNTSQIYNGSIVVPFGITKYSFVAENEYGLKSNVVTVCVDMQYEYSVQPGTAKDLLITYLLDKGTIVSYEGVMPDGGMLSLVLKGFEPVGENYCYIFEEAMEVDGILSCIDVKYSVDMITGEIAKVEDQ